jgi:tetratricopeptide (TPR) repeat protein
MRMAAAAGLCALVLYLATLAPTVSPEDGGELAAAAWCDGIPHPSGFPPWLLCARAALWTASPESAAWRCNLVSAVFGAVSAALVTLLAARFTRSPWAALAAGLVFASSREAWEQSVISEVYALHTALLLGVVLAMLAWSDTGRTRWLVAAAAAFGLGLTNHTFMLLAGPLFAAWWAYVARPWRTPKAWAAAPLCAAVAAACLGLYGILMWRSLANPPMDWGNPETLASLWAVVARRQHAGLVFDTPRSLARFAGQCWVFLETFAWQFTPWVTVLAPVGMAVLWKRHRPGALLLGGLFATVVLGGILVPNSDLTARGIWLNTPFYIPAHAVAAVLIGCALDRPLAGHRGLRLAVLALAVASPLAVNWKHNDYSRYHVARDYAANLLATMDEGAIYVAGGDHTVFPLLYLQIVEGLRPDVTVVNPYGYADPARLAAAIPNWREHFGDDPPPLREALDWISANTSRTVYTALPLRLPGRKRELAGLLFAHPAPGAEWKAEDVWERYHWTADEADWRPDDWTAANIRSELAFARGRRALDEGDTEMALDLFREAARASWNDPDALNNIGAWCAEHGLRDEAAEFLREAIKAAPRHADALRNLGRIESQPESSGASSD